MLIPVILAGGAGTRLWPLSRDLYPKQFLPLTGERSLLQQTLVRAHAVSAEAPIIVTGDAHRFIVAEQLRGAEVSGAQVIVEPVGRNTAPAITLAALAAQARDPAALLLVLPSDHVLRDTAAFAAAVAVARGVAASGSLVTFGIQPDAPHTGYGYIRAGATLSAGARAVARFVEKPDRATAEQYLASGDYLWNSGMFLFSAQAYLEELAALQPAMLEACRNSWAAAARDLDFVRPEGKAFAACPSDSVDYAVMERTTRAAVVPLAAGWSDLGSWDAVAAEMQADTSGNAVVGDVLAQGCRDSLIHASHRLVAAIGLDGYLVVETADAVLVAPKAAAQKVKEVVAALKQGKREEATQHRRVHRPWGWYETLALGPRFQVKRIQVAPGQRLSLQKHHHRAEHWVVVHGTAKVTRGEESFLLAENQSTYIPLGETHRLENPGSIPLEIIEIQSGSYLGEDDIVRFEDRYGRAAKN